MAALQFCRLNCRSACCQRLPEAEDLLKLGNGRDGRFIWPIAIEAATCFRFALSIDLRDFVPYAQHQMADEIRKMRVLKRNDYERLMFAICQSERCLAGELEMKLKLELELLAFHNRC